MNIALVILATLGLLAVVAGWTAHVARRSLLDQLHTAGQDLAAANADVDELTDIVAWQRDELVRLQKANKEIAEAHLQLGIQAQQWQPEHPAVLAEAAMFAELEAQLPPAWEDLSFTQEWRLDRPLALPAGSAA